MKKSIIDISLAVLCLGILLFFVITIMTYAGEESSIKYMYIDDSPLMAFPICEDSEDYIYAKDCSGMEDSTVKLYIKDFQVDDSNIIYLDDTYEYAISVNWQEIPDEEIKKLAESGRICEVLGHHWKNVYPVSLEDIEIGCMFERCSVCGKEQGKRKFIFEN